MKRWKQEFVNDPNIHIKFLKDPFLSPTYCLECVNSQAISYKNGLIKITTWLHPVLGEQYNIWEDEKKWNNSLWAYILDKLTEIGRCCDAGLLEIYWMPTPILKHYNGGDFMIPRVWNSGSYFRSDDNHTEILLTRQQEILKVLCHECFHWIRVAVPLENDKLNELWKNEHNWISNGPLLLEEAYVEALASIWFTSWACDYFNIRNPGIHKIINHCRNICGYVQKIWANGNPRCEKSVKPLLQKTCYWSQQTNVFSYVFWKLFLLESPNIRRFMEQPIQTQFIQLRANDPRIRLQYQVLCYSVLNNDWTKSYSLAYNKNIRFLPQLHVPLEYYALC